MNDAQIGLYRREFSAARKAMRARGIPPKEADAKRKQWHLEIGAVDKSGAPKSSLMLSNREFDAFLAKCRAESAPGDLNAQLRQQDQVLTRILHHAAPLLVEIGVPEHERERYLKGVVERSCGRALEQVDEADFPNILAALTRTAKYKSQKAARAVPAGAYVPPEDEDQPF